MQAFRKGTSRRASSCSYCGSLDHQVNKCPIVEDDWAEISHGRMPLDSDVSSWYKHGRNWGHWYQNAQQGAAKVVAARERARIKKSTTPRPRKCGFCGEHGHTRRDCQQMKSFVAQCQKANANWRVAAYKRIVGELGIYVGSAIKVEQGYGRDRQGHIALITSVNFDELNVMTGFDAWGYEDYIQPLKIEAIVNGKAKKVSFARPQCDDVVSLRAVRNGSGWSPSLYIQKLTSNAAPLGESWVRDNPDCWEWLAKKKSLESLKQMGIYEHITDWASKTQ